MSSNIRGCCGGTRPAWSTGRRRRTIFPFYYPMQTEQPLVGVTPLGWLIPVPLVMLLGPVRAYVLYWLMNFVLCAYAGYLLALLADPAEGGGVHWRAHFRFLPRQDAARAGAYGRYDDLSVSPICPVFDAVLRTARPAARAASGRGDHAGAADRFPAHRAVLFSVHGDLSPVPVGCSASPPVLPADTHVRVAGGRPGLSADAAFLRPVSGQQSGRGAGPSERGRADGQLG